MRLQEIYHDSKTGTNDFIKYIFNKDVLPTITSYEGNPSTIQSKEDFEFVLVFFMETFGQCMVGHRKYNKEQRAIKTFSEVCTVSDEAFGRFTLERCWDSWMSAVENKKQPGKSTVRPLYTIVKSNRKFGGWITDGILRFTEIAKLVKLSRSSEERKKIEETFRKKTHQRLHGTSETTAVGENRPISKENAVMAYNDLSDEESLNDEIIMEDQKNENLKIDNSVQDQGKTELYLLEQPPLVKSENEIIENDESLLKRVNEIKDQEKFEQSNSGQKAKSLEDDHELEDDVEPCEPAQNEGNYTPTQEEVMSAMTSAFSKYLVGYLFTQQHDIQ